MILLTPRQVKIYTWNVKRIEIDRAIYFLEGYTRLLRYPRFHLIRFSFSLIGLGVFTFSRSVHQWFGWVVGGLSRLWDSCSQRLSRLSSPRCSPGLWTPYRWGYSWPRGVVETAADTEHFPASLAAVNVCLCQRVSHLHKPSQWSPSWPPWKRHWCPGSTSRVLMLWGRRCLKWATTGEVTKQKATCCSSAMRLLRYMMLRGVGRGTSSLLRCVLGEVGQSLDNWWSQSRP